MLVRLAHVCIETADLDATETFYGHLGLQRQFEFRNLQNELIGMYMSAGEDTFIEIVKVRKFDPAGVIRHFALQVESVEQAKEHLKAHGIAVSDKKLGVDHTWMVTCHDPNGIFIELHEYTPDSLQRVGGRCEIDYQP